MEWCACFRIVVCRPVRLSGKRNSEILPLLGRRELVQGQRTMAGQKTMSRRQATLFSLIGGATAQSTMWELWRDARMDGLHRGGQLWDACKQQSYPVGSGSIYGTDAQTISWAEQKETRGQSSGSFALHSPFTVASTTDSSLSSSRSSIASKRLRIELFFAFPQYVYVRQLIHQTL